jgi:hypothetical protein
MYTSHFVSKIIDIAIVLNFTIIMNIPIFDTCGVILQFK